MTDLQLAQDVEQAYQHLRTTKDKCKQTQESGDQAAVAIAKAVVAEAKVAVAEAKEAVAEAKVEAARQSGDQAAVAEAKVAVAEAKVAVAKQEVAVAEAKVEVARQRGDQAAVAEAKVAVAEAKEAVAEAKVEAARQSGDQEAVAEAKVAVAKQEVAVAEAKVEVARQSGDQAWLEGARQSLKLAQDAHEAHIRAGFVPGSLAAVTSHPGAEAGSVPGSVGASATHPGAEAGFTHLDDMALMLKRIEEGQKKLEEEQKHIRTTLHVVTESIRYVHETLTPTEARTAKSFQYRQLLDKMQLKVRTMRPDELSRLGDPPDEWLQFAFVWSKGLDSIEEAARATGKEGSSEEREASPLPDSTSDDGTSQSKNKDPLEKECYEPVRDYVAKLFPRLDVHVSAEGRELDHGLLFSENAFTSRMLKPETHGQQVVHITNIHGRTDIVAFDGRGCQRSNVKFAIEMKTKNRDAMRNAEREAITQLLGLNISNAYNSPPVVLSNAVQTHRVFFVEELDAFPFFGIVQGNFDSLRNALWMVDSLLSQPGCTMHLGRGPTPPSSFQEF